MKLKNRILMAFLGLCLTFQMRGHATPCFNSQAQIRATVTQKPLESDLMALEPRLVAMVNSEREKHGLKPLVIWKELCVCARKHSQNMADEKVEFGHKGFDLRAEAMKKIAKLVSFAENVDYCKGHQDPLQVTLDGWMKSPGHRENILSDYDQTGMGIAYSKDGRYFMTQLFAKRSDRASK